MATPVNEWSSLRELWANILNANPTLTGEIKMLLMYLAIQIWTYLDTTIADSLKNYACFVVLQLNLARQILVLTFKMMFELLKFSIFNFEITYYVNVKGDKIGLLMGGE